MYNPEMERVEAFALAHRITDARVLDFYEEHPQVDFQEVNLRAVQLLQGVAGKEVESDVARALRELRQRVDDGVTDAVRRVSAEGSERTALACVERLALLLPKANEEAQAKIQAHLALVQAALQRDMLLLKDDAKLHALEAKVGDVKEEQVRARAGADRVSGLVEDFLQKQGVSQFKGAASEALLEETLSALFPTASVTKTTGHTGCGDFKLERGGLPLIMVENKNYVENVKNTEVQKFLRDATALQCSSILLSQKSGIVGKRDFEIEVNNGRVLVYVHHATAAKITAAVAVVDALEARLANLSASEHTEGEFLPKEVLDTINAEVQAFVQKKNALVTSIKETCKRTVAQVEELHLPELARLLGGKYVSPEAKAYPCEQCARTFDSQRSLNAHMRSHK